MTRERVSLAGTWSFWPDLTGRTETAAFDGETWLVGELGAPRAIQVPGSWQDLQADLRSWSGTAWYLRRFGLPQHWRQRRLRLRFGAVDYFAEVWVNGRSVGEHEGGYTPFDLDITEAGRPGGDNEICVRVLDRGGSWLDYLDTDAGQPEASLFPLPSVRQLEPSERRFPLSEIPHGKQSWYGPMGGIWQDVAVEAVASSFIDIALVSGDPVTGRTVVRTELGRPAGTGQRLVVRLDDPAGRSWSAPAQDLEPGTIVAQTTIDVGTPTVWDLDDPYLYRVTVGLDDRGARDVWTDSFGYRSVTTEGGSILLNGRPRFLLGALDQNYYPPSMPAPDDPSAFRDDVLRAKDMGLNLLRCHIKVPDPRYLRWADRLGLLVWAEIPNWLFLTHAARARARATFAGIVRRDFNRPSVVIRSFMNESWGADLVGERDHRDWLLESAGWARSLDPSRLLVDNSPCLPSFHLDSDLNDFHRYFAMPDERRQMGEWLDGWVSDPASTYSPHGDARRAGTEPLVLSEFGAWGLPDPADLRDEHGRDPWWFSTGAGWAQGMVRPEGVRERFDEWRLDEVFGSWAGFLRESREHQFESIRAQVEEVRVRPAMAGYVLTQFADTQWEVNGIFDEGRRPKIEPERFRDVNADDVVIAQLDRPRFASGGTVRADIVVSHFSAIDLTPCTVEWSVPQLGVEGTIEVTADHIGVASAGRLEIPLPDVDDPVGGRLLLTLCDRDGEVRGRGEALVPLFTRPDPVRDVRVRAVGELRLRLEREGWATAPPDGADVAIDDRWDELQSFVEGGGRAVLLASHATALPSDANIEVRAREGTIWQGHWAQGMSWVRPSLVEGLPVGPRVGAGWIDLVPEHVAFGYGPGDRVDVLGGSYLGWLRGNVATIAGFRSGSGACVLCTFPLARGVGTDPLATELLARLVRLAASPGFAPAKSLT